MYGKMKDHLSKTLAEIKEAGLYKEERLIENAQQAAITVKGKDEINIRKALYTRSFLISLGYSVLFGFLSCLAVSIKGTFKAKRTIYKGVKI